MCGIFAAINFRGKFKKEEINFFKELTNLIEYRGENDFGFYEDDKVFLGHRRLSILDLSQRGHQPMEKYNCIIVFNGEIFNYKELKNQLNSKNFSTTDTEVILDIYREKGIEGFKEFNGMWAFIIYDKNKKKLIISRDRFSIKPLYIYRDKDRLYFASEIKQLIPLIRNKKVNEDKIYKFLIQGLLDYDEETFYKYIFKFPAGETWVIDIFSGRIEKSKYWNFKPNENFEISEKDAIKQFRELFLDSIKLRLRSDVPIGILLSGGLDSSSISAVVKVNFLKDVKTFSIVSRPKTFSEDKYIDILKESLNLHNTKIEITYEKIKQFIEKTLFHMDEPFGSLSVVAQHILFHYIKNETNIKVLLSGQGGDEILGGYLKYFFFFLSEELKKREYLVVLKNILSSFIKRTVLQQFSLKIAKRYLPFMKTFNPLEKIFKENFSKEPIWKVKSFKERQLEDLLKYSLPALTHYEDRNSMAYSLEVRHPFLDHRLVEFSINLPNYLKVKNGWLKYILRKSITELPKKIAWRKDKLGFIIPQNIWIKTYMKKEIYELFTQDAYIYEYIEKNKFLDILDKFFSKKQYIIDDRDIFRFFITELWLRKNF